MLEVESYKKQKKKYCLLLRQILANFRCSGYVLMIETGRQLNIDRLERFC